MTIKSKSWRNYSKDMAATIIQRKFKRYLNKKNGNDNESIYSASQIDNKDQSSKPKGYY
jgi:hypothetical protein